MKYLFFPLLLMFALGCSNQLTKPTRTINSGSPSSIDLSDALNLSYAELQRDFSRYELLDWKKFEAELDKFSNIVAENSGEFQEKILNDLNAPSGEERMEWIRSTPWILTINAYVEEAANDEGNLYTKLNQALRGGRSLDKKLAEYDKSLRSALKNLPSLEGFTFRGATWSKRSLEKYKVGETVVEPAFFSTSLSPAIAKKFAKLKDSDSSNTLSVLYVVKMKSGKPVSVFSEYWPEMEALIAGGAKFRVVGRSPVQEGRRIFLFLEEI